MNNLNEDKYKLICNIQEEIIESNKSLDKINKSINEINNYKKEMNKLTPRNDYLKQYYEYQPLKDKWQMTVDFIMIVGKYFKSSNDFINVMKVCKKYEELVLMYKFNPISNISLFENIQTQHFYKRKDVKNKKDGLFQYIYWYYDYEELKKNKKDNEIFKPIIPYKFITIFQVKKELKLEEIKSYLEDKDEVIEVKYYEGWHMKKAILKTNKEQKIEKIIRDKMIFGPNVSFDLNKQT